MAIKQRANGWNLTINLARNPLRNRRLYHFLSLALVAIAAASLLILVLINLKNLAEFSKLKESNLRLAEKKASLQAETQRLSREVESFSRRYKPAVEEINILLDRKAVYWVALFSRLEEALPSACYLLALNPPASLESGEFRIRVAMNSREELGQLLKNFQLLNFRDIKVLNELYQDGKYQVEMVFRYARVN
ncbi:MAG: hypothetical protein WBI18_09860 [Candidatus Saccharicenans sp.]